MNFQDIIFSLQNYWAKQGCAIEQPYDVEVGAGTMAPATFLRVLGPEPWRVGYVQPSRRPQDGRYGDNPYRLYRHYQFQVILKPSPDDVQQLYLESLRHLGINPRQHDIRFMEDDWESPTLGASGVGWQVWLDGLEITQFTYFQVAGGMELPAVAVELTYGLERISMALQGVSHFADISWNGKITYGEVNRQAEKEWTQYALDLADVEVLVGQFQAAEGEAKRLLSLGKDAKEGDGGEGGASRAMNTPVLAAYEQTLHCSHFFNLLDARGALSVRERAAYIGRVRNLARQCAQAWVAKNSLGV
jgi:glycyl-tRNA synthetase alpha chain